jgi:hypothetical protein
MDIKKLTILSILTVVSLIISLLIIRIFLKKQRKRSTTGGVIHLAFAVSFIGCIAGATFINIKLITILNELLDISYRLNSKNTLLGIYKNSSFLIGLANVWFVTWYFIAHAVSNLIVPGRNELAEVENNNHAYFLIRAAILTCCIFCSIPILEMLLRPFLPAIEAAVYH